MLKVKKEKAVNFWYIFPTVSKALANVHVLPKNLP